MTHSAVTSFGDAQKAPESKEGNPPDSRVGAQAAIRLSRPVVVATLAALIVILLCLSMAGQISKHFFGHPTLGGFVDLFYVDMEGNIPTWFSSMQLLLAALLAAFVAVHAFSQGDAFRRHWAFMTVILVFLSSDEGARLHERTMGPLQRLLGYVPEGAFAPTWLIIGIALVTVIGLSFLRFFLSLPHPDRWRLGAAGVVFLAGAVGMEMATGVVFLPDGLESFRNFEENFGYVVFAHTEEFLEMTGVLLLVDFLLRRLEHKPSLTIGVGARRPDGGEGVA